ncbi:Phosphoadenosine phosphosulfate reductase [Zancudomyces culisetae]|uniref:Phosphoadenosine phosphosulfate reductase n=1 Tax=Zancudomyces culisetae TaxID=1213189 RepID=A0A1R1PKD2_ZANCU|nr:Phosphoadenosine phosphosulfate reductase [Zancudomyces culisetae]|eukprot:OMH81430.1 Phosphoadenosine phosphosulfate reductase [Zancudomyces culisetae]
MMNKIGNVITDMLYGLNAKVPIIFIDTLHHFDETLQVSRDLKNKYAVELHEYRPKGANTRQEFEQLYGKELWVNDPDSYDYLVKVEPAIRAYNELNPDCVITGRRRSQGGERKSLNIIEIKEVENIRIGNENEQNADANANANTGVDSVRYVVKLNPLATKVSTSVQPAELTLPNAGSSDGADGWTFAKIKSYLKAYQVPYNKLLDNGYKSIGDYHSTQPVGDLEDERSGRWKGSEKSECGLHKDYFLMKKAFRERNIQKQKQQVE